MPDDLGKLFVRAKFQTPQGVSLNGFVIESAGVYAIGIVVGDRDFPFNMNASSLAPKVMAELMETLGKGEIPIFPLRYETEHHFANEPNIAGVFDLSDQADVI